MRHRPLLVLLNSAPLILLATVVLVFGSMSPRFLDPQNLGNILVQSSSTTIVAIGMTFVLLTAGVDLSVGAIMFIVAAVAGKLAIGGTGLPLVFAAALGIGATAGFVNAVFVARFAIVPFIVTLATLYFGRGFALWLTQTRAMNLPASFLEFGAGRVAGIPIPILILAVVALVAHVVL